MNGLHQLTAISPLSDLIDGVVLIKHWQQYLILDAQFDQSVQCELTC